MSRDEELRRLIQEQQKDIQRGHVQHPEPGTVPLVEGMEEVLSNEGVPWQGWKKMKNYPECPYHGRAYLSEGYRGTPRCSTCHRLSVYRWRSRNPEKFSEIQRRQAVIERDMRNYLRKKRYLTDPQYRSKAGGTKARSLFRKFKRGERQ